MAASRRQFLKMAGAAAVAGGAWITCREPERPNILWITSEDNSPLFGCYGDTFATTPNFDRLAKESVVFDNAFATSPVCAPARNCLVTGVYPASTGTEPMRSRYPLPTFIKPYPLYLREAGYYCTNNVKTDYNFLGDDASYWDECSTTAHYKNRPAGKPFFAVFNFTISHEHTLHTSIPAEQLRHDPAKVKLPPYHPDTPEIRHDWAQYYDQIQALDEQVGRVLKELEENGLAEDTIVFYYGDHGGVLPRSKRFLYETGLRVPMMIRFPQKYQHLAPARPGQRIDQLITFADIPKSLLSLVGIRPPEYMQGNAFLGRYKDKPRRYALAFRSRMDERYDLSRSLRDKRFRYTRHFNPHRPLGQHLEYLWRMPATRSWEAEYRAGRCNEVQSRFWRPKPAEELYDVVNDPWEVNNLAGNPQYAEVLQRMRADLRAWMLEVRDAGFLPEGTYEELSKTGTIYDYVHSDAYDLPRILETAEMATDRDPNHLPELQRRLNDPDPAVRYWAATGCLVLDEAARSAAGSLRERLTDDDGDVAAVAAEALVRWGDPEGLKGLQKLLDHPNGKVRLRVLNAIYELGDAAAVLRPLAAAKTNDPDEFVARMAAYFV